jgi:hypothetical protein
LLAMAALPFISSSMVSSLALISMMISSRSSS